MKKKERNEKRSTHNVYYQAHILEVFVHVAAVAPEYCVRQTPRFRVWLLRLNIPGDLTSGKVPNLDVLGIPLHGVHTPASGIEPVSVGRRVVGRSIVCATNVQGTDIAVSRARRSQCLGFEIFGQSTSRGGVCREDIAVLIIGAFDQVDFAVIGPVRSVGPDYCAKGSQ